MDLHRDETTGHVRWGIECGDPTSDLHYAALMMSNTEEDRAFGQAICDTLNSALGFGKLGR